MLNRCDKEKGKKRKLERVETNINMKERRYENFFQRGMIFFKGREGDLTHFQGMTLEKKAIEKQRHSS